MEKSYVLPKTAVPKNNKHETAKSGLKKELDCSNVEEVNQSEEDYGLCDIDSAQLAESVRDKSIHYNSNMDHFLRSSFKNDPLRFNSQTVNEEQIS